MTPNSTQLSPHHCSTQDGSGPPDSEGSFSQANSRKLGDFAKLRSLASVFLAPPEKSSPSTQVSDSPGLVTYPIPGSDPKADKAVTLGDFSKIFNMLATPALVTPSSDTTPSLPIKTKPIEILKRPSSPRFIPVPSTTKNSPRKSPTKKSLFKKSSFGFDAQASSGLSSGSDSDQEPPTYSTPASSPSSSTGREPSPSARFTRDNAIAQSPKPAKVAPVTTRRSLDTRNPSQLVLAYQFFNHGPITPIYDYVPTQEAKHKSLMNKLVTERVVDKILSVENPSLEHNGIHVFVDMSNITISFQKALRARYSLHESVRFVPLPSMNMSFLRELLVRGRNTKVLNAGCSMRPDRSEPSYVQELRRLDYRVDLRYRRPEGSLSPEVERGTSSHPRYVEDMVDETLQTRIGESVMQYFDEPGTLVLATGDARPAKFSDGFFTYADRALKMGWNVEVVSWKSSLSGAWTNLTWTRQWGNRFRVIELDGFLDDLLECHAY